MPTLAHVFAPHRIRCRCHRCGTMGDISIPGGYPGYVSPPSYDAGSDTTPGVIGGTPISPDLGNDPTQLTPNPSDITPDSGGGGGYTPPNPYSPSPSPSPSPGIVPSSIGGISTTTLAIGAAALVGGYLLIKSKRSRR